MKMSADELRQSLIRTMRRRHRLEAFDRNTPFTPTNILHRADIKPGADDSRRFKRRMTCRYGARYFSPRRIAKIAERRCV